MKKLLLRISLIIFLFCLTIALAVIILTPRILKKQLENIFIGSQVTVEGCRFISFTEFVVSGISVTVDPIYKFRVKDLIVDYTLPDLPKINILRVTLSNLNIQVTLDNKNIAGLSKKIKLTPAGGVFINNLLISDAVFDIKSKDLSLEAGLSIDFDLKNKTLNWLDGKVKSADIYSVRLKDVSFNAGGSSQVGSFILSEMSFDKLKLLKASAEPLLKGGHFYLSNIKSSLLDGFLSGEIDLFFKDKMRCSADFKFKGIDLGVFVRDFELTDKLELSGSMDGYVVLEADNNGIKNLEGDFKAADPGGMLTIKDDKYLKDMAKRTGQQIDFIVESFTNYSYNKGLMRMHLDSNNIVLDASLDGISGKRNLTVVLHDVLKRSGK